MKITFISLLLIMVLGCSMLGQSDVETAPYRVIESDNEHAIELRYYESLVLVTAPMKKGMDTDRGSAFAKLFSYISGNNSASSNIPMTAPVLLEEQTKSTGVKIPMTAPVLMETNQQQTTMSFVLPSSYTLASSPQPNDPELTLQQIQAITFATIRFNGLLNQRSITHQRNILEQWIKRKGLTITGPYKAAGYNPPFTLPVLRRNEVFIPVSLEKP